MIQVAVGIIRRANKLLVGKRPPNKPYSGYWEFPGGKVEVNETSEAALIRELNEELGITVISSTFWFKHTHTYPDKTVLLEMWLVNEFLGEPQGKENQLLQWATISELSSLPLLDANLSIINQLKEWQNHTG